MLEGSPDEAVLDEDNQEREGGVPARVLRLLALSSYCLLAIVIILTNFINGLNPEAVVVATAAAASLVVVMGTWVTIRGQQSWRDLSAAFLLLFSSRSILHTADREPVVVRDAGVHLDTVVKTIIETGHIPIQSAPGRVAGYDAYPAHHLELAAVTMMGGIKSLFDAASLMGPMLTLTAAVLIYAITKRWFPDLTVMAILAFALWTPVMDFGSLYKPPSFALVIIAMLFVVLPQIHYPRTLAVFLMGLVALTVTHHYSSTMGALAVFAAVTLPMMVEDLRGRGIRAPDPDREWARRLAGTGTARMGLAILIILIPVAYWTVGSYDLERFITIRNPFNFEVTVDPGTQPLDLSTPQPSEKPVGRFFILSSSATLWIVAMATVMAGWHLWRSRRHWTLINAGTLGFGILHTIGLVYPTFFPDRLRGLAVILGAPMAALAVRLKVIHKGIALALPGLFILAMLQFTSVFAVNYLYPWTEGDVRTRYLHEVDDAIQGELHYVLPDNPLPYHQSIPDARMFTSELIGLPTRAVRPIGWLWPPIEPQPPDQLHYWFLEESAVKYGVRTNIPANAPSDVKDRFVSYPRDVHVASLEEERRIMDAGDFKLWHSTFF